MQIYMYFFATQIKKTKKNTKSIKNICFCAHFAPKQSKKALILHSKIITDMNIPPVVKGLLILNIAAYIVAELMGVQYSGMLSLYYYKMPFFHIWQPVTYMFMHGGIMHLLFNMFALWMFGRIMEQVWGPQRFLLYYFVCGIGAAVVQEVCQEIGLLHPYVSTVGASGAVYGILLAFGMTFPDEKIFIIPIPFPIKAKYFIGFYVVLELLEGLGARDGVAHFAHLGGMLFGAVFILLWKGLADKRRRAYSQGYWTQTSTSGYDKGGDSFIDKLSGVFQSKNKAPKMTITYGERNQDYNYNAQKKQDSEEIDRILDKVRSGGYSNLTKEEKETLFKASQK